MKKPEPTEYEWTDRFGVHWEVRCVDSAGRIHSATLEIDR